MEQPEVKEIIDALGTTANKLLERLGTITPRVQNKYDYYNADNDVRDFGISVPKKMMNSRPAVGWASRAVNTLSDRVNFDGFANDTFGVNDMFESANARAVINKAKNDAAIAGCAFIAIGDGDDGRKILLPFTAQEATGVMDQTTGLLKYGLAVTKWSSDQTIDKLATPLNYILFMPEYTAIFENKILCDIKENPTKRPLIHAFTHRASADRPLGKSRLSNTVRRIIQEVARVKRRYEIASEFYSTPQRYINGLANGAKKDDTLDSALGKVWAITRDEDGEKPEIGQLGQMTINQFSDQKKDLARDFCAETALTLRNLGYETSNPTSAESLASMSDDLLLEAQNWQLEMGEQIKQLAITMRLAIDQNDVIADALKRIQPSWQPIFQIDIGATGDAMFKLFDVMPELKGTITAYRMLGIGIREAEQLNAARIAAQSNSFMGGAQ